MRLVHPQPLSLRWAALLTVLRTFLLWFSLLFSATALVAFPHLLPLSLAFIGTSVSIALIAFLQSAPLRCVLCRCNLFLPKSCSKHPSTKSFLGNRMLRMSLDILFGRSFACLYCGERCGCRRFPAKLACDDPSPASHPSQPAPYQTLWQKPPTAIAPVAQKTSKAPLKEYSPFRLLPRGERPAASIPVPLPGSPMIPDSPFTAVDSPPPPSGPPAPFTTALDAWGDVSTTGAGEVVTSPFRELWTLRS